jgi:hypothetical protein
VLCNAPIWLNELLLNAIKICINLLYLTMFIAAIYFVYSYVSFLINKKKKKEKFRNIIKRKSNIVIFIITLVSFGIVAAFNSPQKLMPNDYDFSSITIHAKTNGTDIFSKINGIVTSYDKTIENTEKLTELRTLLNEYNCRRSWGDGSIYAGSEKNIGMVEIYTAVSNHNGNFSPLKFVITENSFIRYTSGNIDFVYEIEDKNNALKSKIIAYINDLQR